MTRHAVWKKDDYFHPINGPRIDMAVEVVKIGEEPMPLVWQNDWNAKPIGFVTDIRVEDGDLTAEVEWSVASTLNDDLIKEFNCRLAGYFNHVTRTKNDDGTETVQEATLRAVSVTFNDNMPGANPGARADKKEN